MCSKERAIILHKDSSIPLAFLSTIMEAVLRSDYKMCVTLQKVIIIHYWPDLAKRPGRLHI